MQRLQKEIERLFSLGENAARDRSARAVFIEFRAALTEGKVRAAQKTSAGWQVNVWVKQGILLGFRMGKLVASGNARGLSFVDKDTFLLRRWRTGEPGAESRGRLVEGYRRLARRVTLRRSAPVALAALGLLAALALLPGPKPPPPDRTAAERDARAELIAAEARAKRQAARGRGSGRVGRTAAGRKLDHQALTAAVTAAGSS